MLEGKRVRDLQNSDAYKDYKKIFKIIQVKEKK